MRASKITLFFVTYIIFSAQVFALDDDPFTQALHLRGDIENGKKVFQLCASCHMDNAWGKDNGSFPVLAGQHKSVTIKQLKDIQNRNRQNPTMYPFASSDSIGGAQNIADVASYIKQLPLDPSPGMGDGKALAMGKTIYKENCVMCHGDKGQGLEVATFPKIGRQHYQYLLRQLQWIRDGLRQNGNPVMLSKIKKMTDKELAAVADYVSRL